MLSKVSYSKCPNFTRATFPHVSYIHIMFEMKGKGVIHNKPTYHIELSRQVSLFILSISSSCFNKSTEP